MLMKKHNSISHHAVQEAVAAGILRVGKEDDETNLVDILTKVLPPERRLDICWHLFWSTRRLINMPRFNLEPLAMLSLRGPNEL